ncbi:MAG: molybdopterin-synthase adenylyltransferase MoeB [Gammaproteobacteria bacterium]|jgi:molybdopterin-synthase adenylyltransferase
MSDYPFEERYSRQIRLPQIGAGGQEKLASARVLVIGMGGLGSPAALYLASAGVGQLVLSDFDRVELSNLQRQVIHRETALNEPKALSAKQTIAALNSDVDVTAIDWQLAEDELAQQVGQADVVLDCSDNFETRFAVNAACVEARTPLVSGAAIRFDGQLTTFDFRQDGSPCYHCLFGGEGFAESCAAEGILSPVVGVIGVLQALEAVKLVTGAGATLSGRLLLFDGLNSEFQQVRYARDPGCSVCGG